MSESFLNAHSVRLMRQMVLRGATAVPLTNPFLVGAGIVLCARVLNPESLMSCLRHMKHLSKENGWARKYLEFLRRDARLLQSSHDTNAHQRCVRLWLSRRVASMEQTTPLPYFGKLIYPSKHSSIRLGLG